MKSTDSIQEVGIDELQRLYLRPATATFPMIYREAAEIHWDALRHHLHSPSPREWTYLRWFQHLIGVAAAHSTELLLTPSTIGIGIPSELRGEMQDWFATEPRRPDYAEDELQYRASGNRELNYRAAQEPRLKTLARDLFCQGHYSEVVALESQIQYPEFLSSSERHMFALARKRHEGSHNTP